jgi:hypothetical protein
VSKQKPSNDEQNAAGKVDPPAPADATSQDAPMAGGGTGANDILRDSSMQKSTRHARLLAGWDDRLDDHLDD